MLVPIKIIPCILLVAAAFTANSLYAQVQKTAEIKKTAKDSITAKTSTVSGTIKDAATGKPLATINVSVVNFSAALTDEKGNFKIKVPNKSATLRVEGEGFQTKEIPLKGQKAIVASLYEESYNSIYDNVKLPNGDKLGSQTVYAATSVYTDGTWGRNNETADGFLQGKAAGLNATMRSGTPNAGAYLALRGMNSLYANNQPLIIVDGAIFDINDYGTSVIANHYTNALATIDPKDIENITIIKDGSSTYGTKGANGVIIITTNHAKELATRIDFAAFAGVNYAPTDLPVMKSADYRVYLSDVLKTRGWTDAQIQAQPYMNDNTSNPDYYRYHNETNWQNQVLANTPTTNYYLKVTGGDNIAKYALSMGYMQGNGITKSTNLKKYSVRFNSELNISKRLTAATNLSFTYYEHLLKDQGLTPKTNPIYLAAVKAPFLPVNQIDNLGVVSPNLADTDTFGISNPSSIISNMIDNSKSYRFYGTVSFKYKLTNNINLGTLLGLTFDKTREQRFVPRKGVANDTLSNAIADSRMAGSVKRLNALYNETYFEFAKKYNYTSDVKIRAGLRFLNSSNEQDIALGYNSATDDFITVGTGVTSLRKVMGDIGKYTWLNYYVSADYALKNKYFLSANVAVDGSSRFGPDAVQGIKIGGNSFAVMPSIAAGWLISSERFLANNKFIDVLKLRASLSKTGNDDIGNYTYKQSYVAQNLLGVQGLVRGNIANPALQWESNTKFNIGADVAILNERLNFSIDYFNNKTDKMLVFETLPSASGFATAVNNSGAMKTTGIDFSINARVINKKSLKLDAGIILMSYRNKITQLPADVVTNYGGASLLSTVGSSGAVFYGYQTRGVFSTDADATTAALAKKSSIGTMAGYGAGDVRFVDVNGDHIIDDKDKVQIGNPNPDFTGAFTSKLTYKAFTLDVLFTFSKGNKIYNGVRANLEAQSDADNQLVSVNNRWRTQGQQTNMPKATWGDPMGNSSFSDRWIEDGSFLRLKTISANYNMPLKSTFIVKYISFYVTGNNLLTFTKYLGYDPEFYSAETMFARGIDVGMEPNYKSVVGGVRIGL